MGAERLVLEDGTERWTLDVGDDERLGLIALGAQGIGGFVGTERDGERTLLVRCAATLTLERAKRLPWKQAVLQLRDWARALAEAERVGLGALPLCPADFVLEPSHLRLDGWVAARSGLDAASSKPQPRFTPPEQGAGKPWDAAARRYVLGLAVYKLIAGTFPFAGESLRRDLEERAERGVPPFADEVARELRPGVQALVLRMLAPRTGDRPRTCDEIARECDALLIETRTGKSSANVAAKAPRAATPIKSRALVTKRRWGRQRFAAAALVALGALAAALGALAKPGTDAAPPPVSSAKLALHGTRAKDCVGCHPREVAEWQRSVMAHASKSPLFGALESAVEEQIGQTRACPGGAGVLRRAGADACVDESSSLRVTGAGGEGWCINCHAPGENLKSSAPSWSTFGDARSRAPLRDVLADTSLDGISCAVCHQTIGPVGPHRDGAGAYEGNATWTSFVTGAVFGARPEDGAGVFGVANSGYRLDPNSFRLTPKDASALVHGTPSRATSTYLRSSEFCGSCHDVRLFGTDVLGASERGEHFKRLRNAYSEWRTWADGERQSGREAPTCQGCHMSQYPGVCESASGASGDADCPAGMRFVKRPAKVDPKAVSHYFTSVEVPLTAGYSDAFASDSSLDAFGAPIGLRQRRDMMLRHTFSLAMDVERSGSELRIPLTITNVGAGHRVPAGFSQEREIWIELEVRDAKNDVVYRVGHVDAPDEDLADKRFLRVTTTDDVRDGRGRPLGLFGADIVDGPDVGQWSPPPSRGGTFFTGKGLINFQNGFLRCVRCIGTIDADGECRARDDQGRTRADRFADGVYDIDTGECRSNLSGDKALFETFFPIGSLDADRGITKAPDAIIDTRSAPPGVPIHYTYVLDAAGRPGPLRVRATLHFRAFPPFLLKAFASYEQRMAARGLRPSGAQVTPPMVRSLEVLDLATTQAEVP